MNKDDLNQIATILFGGTWQNELSTALQVNPHIVRRWASGETPVPNSIKDELVVLIKRKHEELNEALDRLTFCLPHSLLFKSDKFGEVIFFAEKEGAFRHALENTEGVCYYGVLKLQHQDGDCRMMYACKFMPILQDKEFTHEYFTTAMTWDTKYFEATKAGVMLW